MSKFYYINGQFNFQNGTVSLADVQASFPDVTIPNDVVAITYDQGGVFIEATETTQRQYLSEQDLAPLQARRNALIAGAKQSQLPELPASLTYPDPIWENLLDNINTLINQSLTEAESNQQYADDLSNALQDEDLASYKVRIKDVVDIESGHARNRLTAKGDKITNEYELVIRKCNEWNSAGRPANAIPAILQDEVDITGDSAGDICDLFLGMKDQAEEAERMIRKIRRKAAKEIKQNTTVETIKPHIVNAILQLRAIP